VLIMRDVLGFSGAEVADALEMSPEGVYSALQRAHKAVEERLPERTQQATLSALGDETLRRIVGEFVDAWERADVGALAARLAEDAVLAMPPNPEWYRGRDTVVTFLGQFPLTGRTRWRVLPTRANGQPAFGHYIWDGEAFAASELSVLTLAGDRIAGLTVFRDPPSLSSFGLPERISA
jgi:RNA polymerase sigma-70 factor (ECF subfamily)